MDVGVKVFESFRKKRVDEAVYYVVSGVRGHWLAVVYEVDGAFERVAAGSEEAE